MKIWDALKGLPTSRSGDRPPRMLAKVRVVMEVKGSAQKFECESVNVSRSGILVKLSRQQPFLGTMGSQVMLHIDADQRYIAKKFSVAGEIVRSFTQKEGEEDFFLVGIKFLDEPV